MEAGREWLEAGQNVILTVQANMEADQLKLLASSVAPVDAGLAGAGQSEVRVFIDAEEAVASVRSLLERYRGDKSVRGRGAVTLSALGVPLDFDGEVKPCDIDVALGDGWPMNPEIKGALKSLPGGVTVEEL